MRVLILFGLLAGTLTNALPALTYPFNSQVPPVARVGQYYNYTLPSNTFSNIEGSVTYVLSENPSWLSIDSRTRQLHGTPSIADVGNPSFKLIATDSTGSCTDPIVLVVSNATGPYVARPLQAQLQRIGATNGLGALVLQPNQMFNITFSTDTFADTGGNVSAYYGTSDNYTPLPSWIVFDPAKIEFVGESPALAFETSGSTSYEFVLVGTDYPGFAGISATFQIKIEANTLSFRNPLYRANATTSSVFTFKLPIDDVLLDGRSINVSEIEAITTNATTSWLSFNESTYNLQGTPTAADMSSVIQIVLTDTYGNSAATLVSVDLDRNVTSAAISNNGTSSIVFSGPIPVSFNVTEGTFFSYTFTSSVVPDTATIDVSIAGASWLHYNQANRTLYGEVPSARQSATKRQVASPATVTITASENGQTQSQIVGVNVVTPAVTVNPSVSSTTSLSSASAAPTSSPTTAGQAAPTGHSGLSQRQGLALGLGLGLGFAILLLCALLLCCYCKRRNSKKQASVHDNSGSGQVEKDAWPSNPDQDIHAVDDRPRQLEAFQMFKSTSEGRLSGYAVEVNHNDILAPPLATIAHELPPLPESPGFDAVRSAYGSSPNPSAKLSLRETDSFDRSQSNDYDLGNAQGYKQDRTTIKSIVYPRRSALSRTSGNRQSTNTLDTVSTDELFSVRPVDSRLGPAAPSLAPSSGIVSNKSKLLTQQPRLASHVRTSVQTLGTYTSSEDGYIQRFGSQGESLSSNANSRSLSHMSQHSNQPQPWKVIDSQDSYGSFGSYATTDSNMSDEYSLNESLGENSLEEHGSQQDIERGIDITDRSSSQSDSVTGPHGRTQAYSNEVILEAPLSPDWATSIRQSTLNRRPTLNERVASLDKVNLRDFTAARRPMSNSSIDRSAESNEWSAEIAFV